jgi:hypothetical protein
MEPSGLARLLERPQESPFYDLLGGLADNLLTVGTTYAGTFLSCAACGDTFSTRGQSWKCECCGGDYEVKFGPDATPGTPFEATARVAGLTKSRSTPHWYYETENWSVAEFLTQLLRLRPEEFLPAWRGRLGVQLAPRPELETVFCWPRFRFGGKTIQPDLALGFGGDIVLVEFKRPAGGDVPPVEVLGQLCFATEAARLLQRRWHLVLVPGPDAKATRQPSEYARQAMTASAETRKKWVIEETVLRQVLESAPEQLAASIRVIGWESLLHLTADTIRNSVPDSWTKRQTLTKLHYFHASRAKLGLLAPPKGV